MADPNVVNIKGLPRVEEIVEGNLLIVENEQGTNTLDFVNFVIGPNNTSFYNEISNLSAAVVSLSASATALVLNLSASTNAQVSGLNARIDSLSATIQASVSGIYYASGSITIPVNTAISTVQSIVKPASFNLDANDFSLNLGMSAIPTPLSGFPAPYLKDEDVTNVGNVTNFFVRLTHSAFTSAVIVRYRVCRPYSL